MNLDRGNANKTQDVDADADLSDDFEPNRRKTLEHGLQETVCQNTLAERETSFQCSYCDKIFKTPKTLKNHESICSKNPSLVKYNISCESCGTCFSKKYTLVRHKKRCHQQASGSQFRSRHECSFSNCGAKFWHKTSLLNHIKASHEKASNILPVQNLKFTNWEEFRNWKDEEERQTLSYFSEQYGAKGGRSYFYCQQDGPKRLKPFKLGGDKPEESEDESERNRTSVSSSKPHKRKSANKKGKIKNGFMCIAMMKVCKSDRGVEVEYHPTHNHELCEADLKHQPISNATNSYIKKQLLVGASPREILKNLKGEKFSRGVRQLTRNDFIQVKTLRERRRLMASAGNLASDDATAVHMDDDSTTEEIHQSTDNRKEKEEHEMVQFIQAEEFYFNPIGDDTTTEEIHQITDNRKEKEDHEVVQFIQAEEFYFNPIGDDTTTEAIHQRVDNRKDKEEHEVVQFIQAEEFYFNPIGDDTTTEEIHQREDNRKDEEKHELVQLLSQLSDLIKHDSVKNILYPHLKALLKGAVTQCETVVNGVNVDMPLQQMTPTVQLTSCEKLKCQMRPFVTNKISKMEIQHKRNKIPKLLAKIEIKKNLFDVSDKQSMDVDVSQNVQRYVSVTECDNNDPQCIEVRISSSLSQGQLLVRPKVQFVARPIFVPGKSSKLVDK